MAIKLLVLVCAAALKWRATYVNDGACCYRANLERVRGIQTSARVFCRKGKAFTSSNRAVDTFAERKLTAPSLRCNKPFDLFPVVISAHQLRAMSARVLRG